MKTERNCVVCDAKIELLELSHDIKRSDAWSAMWDGAIVERVAAGYGSRHDTSMYILTICDDCVEEKIVHGTLEYIGDYM